MTIHKHQKTDYIYRKENLEYLYNQVSYKSLQQQSIVHIENRTIELIVDKLNEHGKNCNQIRQISQISRVLAEGLSLGQNYCNCIEQAAKLYDIGSISISEEIYRKTQSLSVKEFEIVKNHTLTGAQFLLKFDFATTRLAATMSEGHHEWWDGTGYPNSIQGTEIDTASRIVSLADTAGALFTIRPGREVLEYAKILKYIEERKGLQFDPILVEVFMANKAKIYNILTRKYGVYGR